MRLALIGALAVVAIPVALAANQSVGSWLAAARISAPAPSLYGLEVVSAANGDAAAVWVEVQPATGARVVRSAIRPAGGDWSAPRSLTPAGRETGYPDVAVAADGKAVAVWTTGSGSQSVVQSSVRPPGGRFGSPLTVASTAQGAISTFGPPAVALGPSGEAIAVWSGGSTSASSIVQFATLASRRFGAPRNLAPGTGPDVAVDGNGAATVAWTDGRGVEAAVRPAGGRFQTPQLLGSGSGWPGPALAVDARGDAVVAWGGSRVPPAANAEVRAAFRRAGRRFGPAEIVGPAGDGVRGLQPAIDGGGNAVVLWGSDRYTTFPLQAALRTARGRFGTPQVLSPDVNDFGVAAAPSGVITAVWSRYAGDYLAQVARLERGETAFGRPRALSEAGSNALSTAVSVDAAGNAVAAWARSEGRNLVVEAAGFDAAGPQLRNLQVPSRGKVGQRLAFSVSPLDVWSGIGSTTLSFGDGEAVADSDGAGMRLTHSYRRPGRYTVRVTSTDELGHTTSLRRAVTISRSGGA